MGIKNWTRATRALLTIPEFVYRFFLFRISSKRNILINVIHRNHYSIIKSFFDELMRDENIEPYLTSTANQEEIKAIDSNLEHEEFPMSRFLTTRQALWKRWDAHFDLDYISFRIARPSIFIQIFHGNAGKLTSNGTNYSLHKNIEKYDYLFCLSEKHVQLLEKNKSLRHKDTARLIGFTKLDAVFNKTHSKQDACSHYNIPSNRPVVLYLPSYNDVLSLENIGKELIQKAAQLNITLIIKLHPNSYRSELCNNGKMQTWESYLESISGHENIFHLKDQLAARYYAAADILITDFGSALTEFMITEKPILYFDTEKSSEIVADKEGLNKIRAATYKFESVDELIEKLNSLIRAPTLDSKMLAARKLLVTERFYQPGTATQRAMENTREILGQKIHYKYKPEQKTIMQHSSQRQKRLPNTDK